MNVFSVVPHPVIVSYSKGGDDRRRNPRGLVTLYPGRNKVTDEEWEKVKPHLRSRMDKGFIRASQDLRGDLNRKEKTDLLSQPGTGWIAELSQKAEAIDDGRDGDDGEFLTVDEAKKRAKRG